MDLDDFVSEHIVSFDLEALIIFDNEQLNIWIMPLIGAFESAFEACSVHVNALKIILILSGSSYKKKRNQSHRLVNVYQGH